MDLRSLRHFVAVVDAGSLTRAAANLDIAQPALTAQIKRLESEFDVVLLERSSTGVKPTQAGLRLYQDASALLMSADAMQSRVAPANGDIEGVVRITVPRSLVSAVIVPALLTLRERFPQVRLQVHAEQTEIGIGTILDGRVDLGIVGDPPAFAKLNWRPLAIEPYVLVGIDDIGVCTGLLLWPSDRDLRSVAGRYPAINLADAARLPLLLPSSEQALRRRLDELCAALGITMNIVHEQDDKEVLTGLLLARQGYCLTTSSVLAAMPISAHLVRARLVNPELQRTLGLAWLPGRRLSDAARAVIGLLRDEIAQAIRSGFWAAEHVDRTDYRID